MARTKFRNDILLSSGVKIGSASSYCNIDENGLSKLLLLFIAIIILSSCVEIKPRIIKEESYRLFIPIMISPINKFGVAGGTEQSTKIIGASWFYTWSSANNAQSVEFVPMIWDETHINDKIVSNSEYLLVFNEPDRPDQANISVEDAIILFYEIEEKYPNKKLVSPATINETEWISKFLKLFTEKYNRYPRLNALAFHCYFHDADWCIDLGNKFIDLANKYNIKEVWCTEFAFLEVYNKDYKNQINIFVSWLESEQIIKRYAPYVSYNGECPSWYWTDCRSGANPSLFEKDLETLTELGKIYAKNN